MFQRRYEKKIRDLERELLEVEEEYKDEYEEDFELEYMMFDRHVLVWLVG